MMMSQEVQRMISGVVTLTTNQLVLKLQAQIKHFKLLCEIMHFNVGFLNIYPVTKKSDSNPTPADHLQIIL